jgi:hypothetical protein
MVEFVLKTGGFGCDCFEFERLATSIWKQAGKQGQSSEANADSIDVHPTSHYDDIYC